MCMYFQAETFRENWIWKLLIYNIMSTFKNKGFQIHFKRVQPRTIFNFKWHSII